jgi:hypothetical protein
LNKDINKKVKEFPTVTKNLLNELEQKFLNLLKEGRKLVFSKALCMFFVSLEFTRIAFGM